jgi:predicted ATPase/DNA-binding winged helix-turn-helix (wHTH) protein
VLRRVGANPARMLAFGPFRLFPDRGLLLEEDAPVRIGSRALDILTALVERAGEVVSKEDLIERAWPNTIVVEANLRVHVAGLRKLLGGGQGGTYYIAGVVGRGYRFVAPVALHAEAERPIASMPVTGQGVDLPVRLTRMVGRADIAAKLSARPPQSRFITVVGTGGIGKTSVALAVAEKLAISYRDGARFIDLTPVTNPLAVPSALSSALGVSSLTKDTVPNPIAFLRDRHMLLVLDNCEHVVKVAATLAEQILRAAPHVNVLATSREPLDADGEVVQRLAPLALPPRGSKLTGAAALAFSSVQLFVDRVSANVDGFQMTDEDASVISEICCTLDGLPLAIELAASRADAFGIHGLAALLSDRFKLLMPGRRTAQLKHQTLSAMLDWSYDQLADSERAVLRRLAVFASRFTLESASAVVSASGLSASDVIDQFASLVRKSLVVADVGNASARYRLLRTPFKTLVRRGIGDS